MSKKDFRFWCQKVLPLVYDDSLSYYEVLCKVVKYLNNMATDVSGLAELVSTLQTAVDELSGSIGERVENEVAEKMTELENNGFFEELFSKLSFYLKQDTIFDLWGNIYSNYGNLNGCAYVGSGDYVGYFNRSIFNSDTGKLVRFNIDTGIKWAYDMDLMHGNCIAYVPDTKMLYVAGNYSVDSTGQQTQTNIVFKIALDNPTEILQRIPVSGFERVGGIGYDISTGKFYSDGSYSNVEGIGNKINVYSDEFKTVEKTIFLEDYPPTTFKTNPVYNQGISAVVNGNIFSACHYNVRGIGVWSAETGAFKAFYETPAILNGYRNTGELQTALYDYDNNLLDFVGITYNEGVEGGYNISNIVRTNIMGGIYKESLMPDFFEHAGITNGVNVEYNKDTLLPPHRRYYGDSIKMLSICDAGNLSKTLGISLIASVTKHNSESANVWMSALMLVGANLSILSSAAHSLHFGPTLLTNCKVSFADCYFVSAITNAAFNIGADRACYMYASGSDIRLIRCYFDNTQTKAVVKYCAVSVNTDWQLDNASTFSSTSGNTANILGVMGSTVHFAARTQTKLTAYPGCVLHNCYELTTMTLNAGSTLTITAPYAPNAKIYLCLGDFTELIGGFRNAFKFSGVLGIGATAEIIAYVRGTYEVVDNSNVKITITEGKQITINYNGSAYANGVSTAYTDANVAAIAIEMP